MKNILVVIDGLNYTESCLDPVRYIARLARGRVTIALLETVPASFPPLIGAIGDAVFYNDEMAKEHTRERYEQIIQNAEKLRTACAARGMDITLHTITERPAEAVIHESRFADLLLVHHSISLSAIRDSEPPRFIQDILARAQCPVLVLPSGMQVIRELVLTYNGTYSSMYAIRSFLQLFPALSSRKVTVLYIAENGRDLIPDEIPLRHYLEGYGNRITYKILKGDPGATLKVYLQFRQHTLVTLGAYGRSRTSRFFNSSSADDIVHMGHTYTFITHP